MANIPPGTIFNITVGEEVFRNMRQTRFTGYDTSVVFENSDGFVVPLTAVTYMERVERI